MNRAPIIFFSLAAITAVASVPGPLLESIEAYCIDCHDSTDAKGEVDLEVVFETPGEFVNDGRLLELLHRTLSEGEMPPVGKKQPSAKERQVMVGILDKLYGDLAERHRDEPGHVVMQRLTKQEYRNVLRDLTDGIVVDAGKYLPEEGGTGEGFDNVGEAQGMETAQVEKFLEAGRLALRHMRATPAGGMVWRAVPREPVDEPAKARLDAVNDILEWYARQQYHWAFNFTERLEREYGTEHGAFLEAAWRYKHRQREAKTLAEIAKEFVPPLPVVPLEKWWDILSAEPPGSPWIDWANAWSELPGPGGLEGGNIRQFCNNIVSGKRKGARNQDWTFAPPYELSFLPNGERAKTLESAKKDGIWPFRIEIGEAKELFLVVTQGGDDNFGDFAIWHSGVFEFPGGETKPWHQVTKIRGANSGRIYQWGKYNDGTGMLRADAYGTRPPGALKIDVPKGAEFLTVKLEVDKEKTQRASIQALVLKHKPPGRQQAFYPGRLVFGGKKGAAAREDDEAKARRRELLRINIPAANRTKAGLNAERNVMSGWERTDIQFIGGPWDHQDADKVNPNAPYHMTSEQILQSASPEALGELEGLLDRLESIAQVEQQKLLEAATQAGWEKGKEGVFPPGDLELPVDARCWAEGIGKSEKALAILAVKTASEFAAKAWRRPVTEKELELFQHLFEEARADGLSYDSSLKQPLLAVLASPNFLFRLPRGSSSLANQEPRTQHREPLARPLDGFELANRLAFFLWGSIPDKRLLDLAKRWELTQPDILRKETRRMLADDRAEALATLFAAQVFGFAGFEDFNSPDPERFPQFTPQIRTAMIREVARFNQHLFQGHAPLTDLISADYSFVNKRLAKFYGMGGIEGEEFRKAKMPAERGGLTGMGIFLAKTSEPLRTSPVVRGVWIFESILGRELPSPPANVPSISQDETDEKGRSVRAQLEAHRKDKGCASCHDKVDPLGIALENFDPIGRWRTKMLNGSKPDAVATAKDGFPLSGPTGLKSYLASHQDATLRHVTKKLLGYALGRSVAPGDKALLDRLHKGLPHHGYRFPWLVEEIVTSPQFMLRSY